MADELGATLAGVKELGALLERRRGQELTPDEFDRATELVLSAKRTVWRELKRHGVTLPSAPLPAARVDAAPRARPREHRRSTTRTSHGPPDREPDPPPRPPEAGP